MDARMCGLHQDARRRVAQSVPCPTRVRFEEEDTADVWASFVSETERGEGLLPLWDTVSWASASLAQEEERRSGPAQHGELGLATCWAKSQESERGEGLPFSFYFPRILNQPFQK